MSDKFESEYLDDIEIATNRLISIAYSLETISNAFYTIGNKELSDKVYIMSADIMSAQKNINLAVGKEINRQLDTSQKFSDTLIKTALVSLTLGSQKEQ